MSLAVAFPDIEAAQRIIRGKVLRTPTIPAPRLSERTGAEIFVKYENMQATASFKDRGALVKLMSLSPEARAKGVVAMSAGNHAQAVAFHARRLAIPATIVMPVATPFVKVGNTERLGAKVVLAGETLHEARAKAEEIARESGLTLVHPYDDPKVIAGQGTAGLEILRDAPDLDCLVVPIGGGGLISGVAVAAKHLKPAIEIYGVQCDAYPAMLCAVRGTPPPAGASTLAEGIAVKVPGSLTIPIVKALVNDILIVGEEAIERAVAAFLTLQKTMAEGAGASGLAAVMANPGLFLGKKVGIVLTGGNIDPRILASITIRGLEREERIVGFRIYISDRPGTLGRIATLIGKSGANIIEVWHQRLFLDVPAQGATVDVLIEVKDAGHAHVVEAALKADGFTFKRLRASGSEADLRG